MSIPKTQKQWVIQGEGKEFETLVFQPSAPVPKPGDNDVLVRFRGASLNFRDLLIPRVSVHSSPEASPAS
jgi:NADPH:quinone reductase-like Zn-dependent oxidoreductase